MGSLITIILIVCIVYAVKSSKGKQPGQQARPVQNTYQQPRQARPVQNTYQQPGQARPMQNTYQQPKQARPVQNTYQQPRQVRPAQNIGQQLRQEPLPVRREPIVDSEPEIRIGEGIAYLPETVLDVPSELMCQLDDLMVMGYQAKLSYERDFLAEGMAMLTNVTSNE